MQSKFISILIAIAVVLCIVFPKIRETSPYFSGTRSQEVIEDTAPEICPETEMAAALSLSEKFRCFTEDNGSIDDFQARLSDLVNDLNAASDQIEASRFSPMDYEAFKSIYEPFNWSTGADNPNSQLDFVQVDVESIGTVFPDDINGSSSIWFDTGNDNLGYKLNISPDLADLFDRTLGTSCIDIRDIEHGCHGTIFLQILEEDDYIQPTIVGLHMAPLSEKQIQTAVINTLSVNLK
jgi:hypothetical protein